MKKEYDYICSRQPMVKAQNHANHLGTLGTGNHFIEVHVLFEQKYNVLNYILLFWKISITSPIEYFWDEPPIPFNFQFWFLFSFENFGF